MALLYLAGFVTIAELSTFLGGMTEPLYLGLLKKGAIADLAFRP
jgi:hypothetical protein